MTNPEKSLELKRTGLNCSQAVLCTYCEKLGLNFSDGKKISAGFGGGMGRQGSICGAVTGAYMLLGLRHDDPKDPSSKEKVNELVAVFNEKFRKKNEFLTCRELLGTDFETDDTEFLKLRMREVCPKVIYEASEIVEEMIE